MTPHPLAEIFPPMSDFEYEELKADIKENGVLDKITLFEGKILDGRHRLKACKELGIDCPTEEFNGASPEAFVMSKNGHRRHLSIPTRCAIGCIIASKIKKDPRNLIMENIHNKKIGTRQDKIKRNNANRTISLVSKQMNVGSTSMAKVYVLFNNHKALFNRVYSGELGVQTAYAAFRRERKVVATPKPETRVNLESFKTGIVIPSMYSDESVIDSFIKTMNAHGWSLEVQCKAGKVFAHWFGNGFMSVRTGWGHLKPEFKLKHAIIIAANERLESVKKSKIAA